MNRAPESINMEVKKIHLLVHPGFIAGPDVDDDPEQPTDEEVTESHKLLKKYVEKAKMLDNNEIMVVFGYADVETFHKHLDMNAEYTECICEMEEILDNRLIYIDSHIDPFDGDGAIKQIKSVSDARGFSISENIVSEAFGETAGVCVVNCAQNINITGNFKDHTVVNLDLTDQHPATEKDALANIKNNISDFRNISRLLFKKNGEVIVDISELKNM